MFISILEFNANLKFEILYLFIEFIIEHMLHVPFSPSVHGGVHRAVSLGGHERVLGAGAHADWRLHGAPRGHGDWCLSGTARTASTHVG